MNNRFDRIGGNTFFFYKIFISLKSKTPSREGILILNKRVILHKYLILFYFKIAKIIVFHCSGNIFVFSNGFADKFNLDFLDFEISFIKKECPHFTPLRKISVPNCCNTAHFHNQSQVLQVAPYCSPFF